MKPIWRPIEVLLAVSLPPEAVAAHIEARIRVAAGDAGDLIERIRILGSEPHSDQTLKWTAAYIAGPPHFLESLIVN